MKVDTRYNPSTLFSSVFFSLLVVSFGCESDRILQLEGELEAANNRVVSLDARLSSAESDLSKANSNLNKTKSELSKANSELAEAEEGLEFRDLFIEELDSTLGNCLDALEDAIADQGDNMGILRIKHRGYNRITNTWVKRSGYSTTDIVLNDIHPGQFLYYPLKAGTWNIEIRFNTNQRIHSTRTIKTGKVTVLELVKK